MFCDSCGTTLQAGQSYCQRCGKAIVGGVLPGAGRVARHAQMLGILWVAYSTVILLVSFFMLVFFQHVFPAILRAEPPHGGGPPPEVIFGIVRPMMHFIGILLAAKAVAGIIAGVGILQRAEWSRMLAIVLGCISLISVPFGTAIGIYTLWVLLSPNADAEFRARAVTA